MPIRPLFHVRLMRQVDKMLRDKLWLQVLVALGAGALVGFLLGPDLGLVSRGQATLLGAWMALPGKIFLAAVGMVTIPLAATSIMLGVVGSGGGAAMKAIGGRLAVYVVLTTLAAAAIGIALARWLHAGRAPVEILPAAPSVTPPPPDGVEDPLSPLEAMTRDLPNMIADLIPQNISVSLVEQDMLAIVIFALFVGVALINTDNRDVTKPIVALAQAVLEVCMSVIRTAMRFAPVAVFGLIAETATVNGIGALGDLIAYCGVVLLGLLLLLVLYLAIVSALGRMGPVQFMRAAMPVQLLAFSTSSSAAVMPLTMKVAIEKLEASPAIAGAVVPLAATVNMAGTALYQAVAIIFLADTAGAPLSMADIGLIMVTLTASSIGAPAAPGASIAILAAVATNFGVPLTGLPLILGVDRILDMARTSVNVTGDLVACRLLSARREAISQTEAH